MTPKENAIFDRDRHAREAAKILSHYFNAALPRAGIADREVEIRAAVDSIIEAAVSSVAAHIAEPVTKPPTITHPTEVVLRNKAEREGWDIVSEKSLLCKFVDGLIEGSRIDPGDFPAYLEKQADEDYGAR